MPSSWGRPPRHDMGQDAQTLAIWVLIVVVVGYLLFPNFFKDVYSRLSTVPVSETSSTEINLPNSLSQSGTNSSLNSSNSPFFSNQDFPSVYSTLYNSKSEISSGYWVIYVGDGKFEQFPLTSDTYTFVNRLIESDQKAIPKEKVILAANGQIRQFEVSEEVYTIILNMAAITARTRVP
ncbi:MAG: hypothetical protein ACYCVD_01695 [Desulfitobacteriaceae bacterium]